MSFEELILAVMKKLDGQRTVSAPYHLLKGKKSGQTIQDIGYFKLYSYFAVLPGLTKEVYDEAVIKLKQRGWLSEADGQIRLSEAGLKHPIPVHNLNGWKYQGRERLFFARLSLAVQTFSYRHVNIRTFDPIQTSTDIQHWVRGYLLNINYRLQTTYEAFKEEVSQSLERAAANENQKTVLMGRLSGNGVSGQTWQQMAADRSCTEMDVRLEATEALHAWMEEILTGAYPLLKPLLEGVVRQSSLTDSTKRTLRLFQDGHSIEEIAAIRKLRPSTIEDHFVEMAMNDPAFDVTRFMKQEDYERIADLSRSANTKRLRDIKEQLPEMTYFQIRLALSAGGEEK